MTPTSPSDRASAAQRQRRRARALLASAWLALAQMAAGVVLLGGCLPGAGSDSPYGVCTDTCGDSGRVSCQIAGRLTDPASPPVHHCTHECVSDGDCPLGVRGAICLSGPYNNQCYQRCGTDLPPCPTGTRCETLLTPAGATFCEPVNSANTGG